ncbi:MAG TPA: hypothetical protein VJJ78_02315 [Candidatus Saccharimonadales bacterium]|nr:hypothetical protein [Candidatus Saccharimonadales bacterium]
MSQVTHLHAVQGSQEERVSRRNATVSERLTPADTAMWQEHQKSFWLCQEAVWCGVEVVDG